MANPSVTIELSPESALVIARGGKSAVDERARRKLVEAEVEPDEIERIRADPVYVTSCEKGAVLVKQRMASRRGLPRNLTIEFSDPRRKPPTDESPKAAPPPRT